MTTYSTTAAGEVTCPWCDELVEHRDQARREILQAVARRDAALLERERQEVEATP